MKVFSQLAAIVLQPRVQIVERGGGKVTARRFKSVRYKVSREKESIVRRFYRDRSKQISNEISGQEASIGYNRVPRVTFLTRDYLQAIAKPMTELFTRAISSIPLPLIGRSFCTKFKNLGSLSKLNRESIN